MNKKLLYGIMLPLFAVGLVAAVYVVSSFVITTDVQEPFSVEYAIIGSAGNWVEGDEECINLTDEDPRWEEMIDVDVDGLYAGEGRMVCAKIVNAGEGEVDYTFSAEVQTGFGNYAECLAAFDSPSISGVVGNKATVKNGFEVLVNDGATPVNDCQITLSVSRG